MNLESEIKFVQFKVPKIELLCRLPKFVRTLSFIYVMLLSKFSKSFGTPPKSDNVLSGECLDIIQLFRNHISRYTKILRISQHPTKVKYRSLRSMFEQMWSAKIEIHFITFSDRCYQRYNGEPIINCPDVVRHTPRNGSGNKDIMEKR